MEEDLGWKGPRRVQIFLWTAAYNRLLTVERRARIMGVSSMGQQCKANTKSLMHVLRDCAYAKDLWLLLEERRNDLEFFVLQGKDWLDWGPSRRDRRKVTMVSWVKLNTDGTRRGSFNLAGYGSLLRGSDGRLDDFDRIKFQHVYREGNACADKLVNLSFDFDEVVTVFDRPSRIIQKLVYLDFVGIFVPRSVK
ncbi:uncharacterized protein LOC114718808 [Neltuma alba]|uniref:uncharacterized protein LOC114718808 n=1 Tax=Neltuma alba TaxID=207710 RepID=UPI0010A42106|nr:uncharacterized protein LOC114718808 [Prosopis alba]